MFANDEVRRARKTFSAMHEIVEMAGGASENAIRRDRFAADAKGTKEDVWDRDADHSRGIASVARRSVSSSCCRTPTTAFRRA